MKRPLNLFRSRPVKDCDERDSGRLIVDLLGEAKARAEFDRFVAEQGASLLRTAYLATWDAGEAEELMQECLLRVARRWDRVRGMEYPQAYARRVLANLVLDGAGRRARRVQELDEQSAGAERLSFQEDSSAAVAEREALFAALAGLSRRQRLTLALRYFADLSEAETAAALGCSVGTVKSTASRTLAQLREQAATDGERDFESAAGSAQTQGESE